MKTYGVRSVEANGRPARWSEASLGPVGCCAPEVTTRYCALGQTSFPNLDAVLVRKAVFSYARSRRWRGSRLIDPAAQPSRSGVGSVCTAGQGDAARSGVDHGQGHQQGGRMTLVVR